VPGDISVANLQATMGVDEGEAPPWRIELRAEGAESAVGRIGNIRFRPGAGEQSR
jgi:hypothetical protein